jgi:Tetratricopeptide repeat
MRRSFIIAILMLAAGALPVQVMAQMGGGPGGWGRPMGGSGGSGSGMPGFEDYGMALRLIHNEQYADAIPYLNSAHAGRPHNADILNYLGFAHRMLGDYPAALDFYQRALQEDPDHKLAHENLGELYLNMHDVASANGQLAELTRLCPSGCDDRDTLTKSIATYVAANPAPAPAQAPAPK